MNYEVAHRKPLSKHLIDLRLGTPFTFRDDESNNPVFIVAYVSFVTRKEGYIHCYDLKSSNVYIFEEESVVYPLVEETPAKFKYEGYILNNEETKGLN